jgi:hypothetical protein
MLKGDRALRALPSETESVTSLKLPTLTPFGVPESRPLLASKLSHAGRFATAKVSGCPSGSVARGVNW